MTRVQFKGLLMLHSAYTKPMHLPALVINNQYSKTNQLGAAVDLRFLTYSPAPHTCSLLHFSMHIAVKLFMRDGKAFSMQEILSGQWCAAACISTDSAAAAYMSIYSTTAAARSIAAASTNHLHCCPSPCTVQEAAPYTGHSFPDETLPAQCQANGGGYGQTPLQVPRTALREANRQARTLRTTTGHRGPPTPRVCPSLQKSVTFCQCDHLTTMQLWTFRFYGISGSLRSIAAFLDIFSP
jgi:hypothetical protein